MRADKRRYAGGAKSAKLCGPDVANRSTFSPQPLTGYTPRDVTAGADVTRGSANGVPDFLNLRGYLKRVVVNMSN